MKILMGFIGALLLTNVSVAADCRQGNLTGNWFLSGETLGFQTASPQPLWCTIVVASGGSVLGSESNCRAYTPIAQIFTYTANITSGLLQVDQSCEVTGRIRFCNSPNPDGTLNTDECEILRVLGGRLSTTKNKLILATRGRVEIVPGVFQDSSQVVLTGVKE